jgi:hypothetical protein
VSKTSSCGGGTPFFASFSILMSNQPIPRLAKTVMTPVPAARY